MPVPPELIERARQADVLRWLSARYPHVRLSRSRRSLSVDGVLRADLKPDGHWVACDWHSGAIGDSISLVRHLTGCSFAQAVEQLTGDSLPSPAPLLPLPPRRTRPRMPLPAPPGPGREYLRGRGIGMDAILEAERSGTLVHARGGVAFAGRDEQGEVRLLNLRLYAPLPPIDGKGRPLDKLDLEGSDKSYPVMLRGDGSGIAFVEGGVNLLAAREVLARMGWPRSAVLATGGVGIRSFMDRETVRQQVSGADRCWVFWEREHRDGVPSPAKQALTDPFRHALMDMLASLRHGDLPEVLVPPQGCGDVADWNLRCPEHPPCAPPPFPAHDQDEGMEGAATLGLPGP